MPNSRNNPRFEKARLIILPSLLAALFGFLLTNNSVTPPVQGFSSGPPAGYTGAPGEEPEACAECHVPADAGTGHISITAPQTYVPGQTYPITVTHTNADQTRLRWGFELTVLDTSDEKAGNLESIDGLTQLLNNQGPGGARQYIEHTAAGTFVGQQNGASWTFNWTAPPTDVGPVTFYTAGNQANNDGNTSGDYVYKTFVASAPASSTPDFVLTVTPSTRNIVPGASAQYSITAVPLAGFTGVVNLNATGLPAGATSSFNPATINITDAFSRTATLTITTIGSTPTGNQNINITGSSGALMHTIQAGLQIISPTSVDLAIAKTASPNPGQVGANLSYRLSVTNNGPAQATNVMVNDTLPAGVTFVSSTATQGSCNVAICSLGNLASGATAIVTIVVAPNTAGQLNNSATVSAAETDFATGNNSVSLTTLIQAAAESPVMLDPNLEVTTVVSNLDQPTSMTFLGSNDFFVLEKATGKVQRIVNGTLQSTVLDLAVNSASERGLLGIALHPQFASNGFVYLFWSESNTGADTTNVDATAVLGQRVDRYNWNGSALTFDRNLIRLRALQQDPGQPSRGNHNGGVLRFGGDGKLYILFGDNGRRGLLQNLTSGGPVPDDQFGGPEPDDQHLTGVVLRLNDDGTTPTDNPFFSVNSGLTGQAAANIKKVFAYGVRNGFGMTFDHLSGNLWTQENGDDAFDEINKVKAGFNGGWVQIMGPVNRIAEYKSIESTYAAGNLQQLRWAPSNIADTPQAALSRLYMLPGAQYTEPEFSWKYAVAPSPIGFVKGRGIGPQFEGDMFVGGSRTTLANGYLFRFRMAADRQHFAFTDQRLADLVADNDDKFDIEESESLLIGRDFGITTDIQTGPNGNLFVVSLLKGAVYEIKSKPSTLFFATLDGAQEVPSNNSSGSGKAVLQLSPDEKTARVSVNFAGLSTAQTDAHIHGPAAQGVSGPVIFPLPIGQFSDFQINLTPSQVQDLKNGLLYVNVHTGAFTAGEIRGQFVSSLSGASVQFNATSYAVNEGEGTATITVTRAGNTSGSAAIEVAASPGSATQGDYSLASAILQFGPGETIKAFTIPISDDVFVENSESLQLVLRNPATGAFIGSPAQAVLTILDNDVAHPVLLTEEGTSRAVALDSVTMLREPFPLTNLFNFSLDRRTRVTFFASGFELMPGENLAIVSAQAEDSQQRIHSMTVENVTRVPGLSQFTQVVVKIPESIQSPGEYLVSITVRGASSNKASIAVQ